MSVIRSKMPVLARHEGVWEGTYRLEPAASNQQAR